MPLGTSEIWGLFLDDEGEAVRRFTRKDSVSPGVLIAAELEVDERFVTERYYETVGDVMWEYCVIGDVAAVTACLGERFYAEVPAKLGGHEVAFVGPRCFANKRLLYQVSLPDTVVEICDYAFMFSGITELRAPARLKRIGMRAFYRCWQLVDVGLGTCLEEIGDEAFCLTQLSVLNVPRSVHRVGTRALSNSPLAQASGFTALRIEDGSPYFIDEVGGLYKRGAREVALIGFMNSDAAQYTVKEGTTTISAKAFAHNKTLHSIELPDGLRTIQDAAFSGCRNLAEVQLPSSLERIGDAAFKNCRLSAFTVPANLRELGDDVLAIKENTRYHEISVRRLSVEEGNESFYVSGGLLCERGSDGDTALLYFGPGGTVTIPDEVVRIAPAAFAGQTRVERLVLHDHIGQVGELGFGFASGLAEAVFCKAAPDGSDVTARFPSYPAGVAAARCCFRDAGVDVRTALRYTDNALLGQEPCDERDVLMVKRLAEPYLLAEEAKQRFVEALSADIGAVCVSLAVHNHLAGYTTLLEQGILNADNLEQALNAVAQTNEAAAVTQLLSLRGLLSAGPRPDFGL